MIYGTVLISQYRIYTFINTNAELQSFPIITIKKMIKSKELFLKIVTVVSDTQICENEGQKSYNNIYKCGVVFQITASVQQKNLI